MVKSRFLSVFMSLVLALGLCPLPAFAAPADGNALAVAVADDDGDDGDDMGDEWGDEGEDPDGSDDPDDEGDDLEDPDGEDDDSEDEGDDEEYASLEDADVTGIFDWTYDGKAHIDESAIEVTLEDEPLVEGEDYEIRFEDEDGEELDAADITDAGDYIAYIEGIGDYEDETLEVEFTVKKANNTLKASAKKSTVSFKAKNLKKKAATTSNVKVSQAKGAVKFKNTSTNKTAKKFTISQKGALKVTKGLKAGKYPVVVQVTADGTDNYKKGSASVSFTVQVKK